MNKEISYEKAIQRIEEIAELIESNQVNLEEILGLFEEANKLIKVCESKLHNINKEVEKIKIVSEDGSIKKVDNLD